MLLRPYQSQDGVALARLRLESAEADQYDPISTMESLPDEKAIADSSENSELFRVIEIEGQIAGYASVRWWDESAGPRVFLCDWYLAPAFLDPEIDQEVLSQIEAAARAIEQSDEARDRSVIGTNASSVQPSRISLFENNGYNHVFSQIEMELRNLDVDACPLPSELTLRTVTPDDVQALIDLNERAWAGRPFFAMPTVEGFRDWLENSDLDLFQVATIDDRIVAFVASTISDSPESVAEIEVLQVDPDFQRRGIASALITHNLSLLNARGVTVVRLNTEGHDPAGARSLYEHLGFTLHRSYLRFRKPL